MRNTFIAVSARATLVLAALVTGLLLLAGPARAGGDVDIEVRTTEQRELLRQDGLKVHVESKRDEVTARATVPAGERADSSEPIEIVEPKTLSFGRDDDRTTRLDLTRKGRRAVEGCGDRPVRATAGGADDSAKLAGDDDGCYTVGVASRQINPDADGTFGGEPVYLGGYGLGANPITGSRPATGVLGEGISVRALSVGAGGGGKDLAIADIETQGWFAATKDGPLGLVDMRKAVVSRTNGALEAQEVVIQSDHTHSGPDTIGVWGGVPKAYRRYIFDRTVDAIVKAFRTRRPGTLHYGTAGGRDLLSNQFDYDEQNEVLDSDVRVLQGRDGIGRPFATLLNFSAHTTVLGSGNTKVSGDWVQAANPLLEKRFGGEAMTMVGTLGRTQPADRGCDAESPGDLSADEQGLCAIESYADRVVDRAEEAVADSRRIKGSPVLAAKSYLIQDPATNAPILGFNLAGDPVGADINRSLTPPWLSGNVVGTVTASARIGDVLLSSMPGEAYPQIPLRVKNVVPARGYLTAGLANDQLGYLIAPYTAYPEPIRRTFFSQRGDEVSPIDNDNYAFNVSHTMGERVICSLLRGAGAVFGEGLAYRNANAARCAPFANDLALPAGADAD